MLELVSEKIHDIDLSLRKRRYVRHLFLSILSDRSFSSTDRQSNLDSLVLLFSCHDDLEEEEERCECKNA